MSNIQAVTRQNQRPFCELVRHCEIRAIASRIAAAVVRFFIGIVNMMCCCRRQGQPISVQRDEPIPARVPTIETTRPPLNIHVNQNLVNKDTHDKAQAERIAASLIQPEMNDERRHEIIAAIAAAPPNERESVATHACRLINGRLDVASERWRENLIRVVAGIPAQERTAVIQHVQRVHRLLINDDGHDAHKVWIMEAVTAIPVLEREAVIQHVVQLITPGMRSLVASGVIHNVARISPLEREGVIQHVREFMTREGFVDLIIAAVAAIPVLERDAAMQRARAWITPEMRAHDVVMMIERAALQQPNAVYQPAPAQGVNVHEGDRDQRMHTAIQLLRQYQKKVSTAQITQAKDAFISYIRAFQMDPVQRQLAIDALLKPRGEDSWGPLLGGEGFTVLGLSITGEEVIGRLWIFASQLGEKEQANAKRGMILALHKSYENGARVCNQGKTQRLFIAVLQGRLKGVNIDNVVIPNQEAPATVKKVSKADMMDMFFTPARRAITNKKELLAAADQFCNENPGVERQALLAEVNAYTEVDPENWTETAETA